MVSNQEADPEKVRILLSHLMRAKEKVDQRFESRSRLKEQMEKVKKSTRAKSAVKEIKELEKRLAEALEKEDEISRRQKSREIATMRLKDRVHELELKISKYLELKRQREKRIVELEDKIKKKFSAEKRQVDLLEGQLKALEVMFEKITGEKKYTKAQIESVKKKIGSLKKRLAKVK